MFVLEAEFDIGGEGQVGSNEREIVEVIFIDERNEGTQKARSESEKE